MLQRNYNLSVLGLLLLGGAMIGLALRHDPLPPVAKVHSLRNWQAADTPDGYPVGVTADHPGRIPEFDPRFRILGGPERFQMPAAPRLDQPLGSEIGALAYNAQPFGSPNERRGGNHTGDDLNGIGGMNTDRGDPVLAAGNGRVLFAGEAGRGWGKVVILGHRDAGGANLHSMYAHLERIDVALGTLVSRGGRVGTVGTAGDLYPAHLHFEMRRSDSIDLGRGYTRFESNRLDPSATVRAAQPDGPDALAPPPLGVALADTGWEDRLILEGAEKVPDLFGEEE